MSATIAALPTRDDVLAGRVRLTVDEYERLWNVGELTEYDKIELIDGWVVKKMSRNAPHDSAVYFLLRWLMANCPQSDWHVRCQLALVLARSVPEPDHAVVRAAAHGWRRQQPRAADAALVVEVSDSSLHEDRNDKLRVYALDRIPVYWIVNIPDRRIEVYMNPSGDTYATRQDQLPGQAVPLVLDGVHVGDVPVDLVLG
ncbi:MAG: Uma2 family endonuclease [Gemmataceae bacterium]|nr:Uma2 family endonuclease [Gemmataceae bacterium]